MNHGSTPDLLAMLTPDPGALDYRDRMSSLQAEVELWRAVNDSLPDLVLQLDSAGRVVYFNRWLEPSMRGKYLPDLVTDPADRSRLIMLINLVLNSGDESFDYVDPQVEAVLTPNGGCAFEYAHVSGWIVECRAAPIRHRGRVVGAAVVVREVTDQRRTRRDLDAVTGQLAQAQKLSAIGQLAAGMAHEINTPIQFVSDNTTFVERSFARLGQLLDVVVELAPTQPKLQAALAAVKLPKLREQVPRALSQSLEGLARVAKIVGAMKDFSHPSNGTKELVSLRETIETTATIARNEWKYVAELSIDVPDDVPRVPLLRDEFNQVLLNLIVNSAHAVAERYPSGTLGKIRLSARTQGEGVEIRISDDGAGIPEAVRERVFEPFFTTKAVGKGTGQGLAIAWSVVVEKHGGTLRLESEVGVGTTFVISLPIKVPTES